MLYYKITSCDCQLLLTSLGVQSQNLRLNIYSGTSSYSFGRNSFYFGRLEVSYSNQWIPFTIDGFDMHEADLACRWLGYGFASRYALVGTLG